MRTGPTSATAGSTRRAWRRDLALVLLGLTLGATGTVLLVGTRPARGGEACQDASTLYARAAPAVVTVGALGDRALLQELGAGFAVDAGLVVTALHVLQKFDRYGYRTGPGELVAGQIVDRRDALDLALLRPMAGTTDSSPLPRLQLATRVPAVGETVVAIGSPDGLPGTLTTGTVCGLRRARDVGLAIHGLDPELELIQTDAVVGRGNSGGPLLSLDGQVLGMVVATFGRGERFGFAVEARALKTAIDAARSR